MCPMKRKPERGGCSEDSATRMYTPLFFSLSLSAHLQGVLGSSRVFIFTHHASPLTRHPSPKSPGLCAKCRSSTPPRGGSSSPNVPSTRWSKFPTTTTIALRQHSRRQRQTRGKQLQLRGEDLEEAGRAGEGWETTPRLWIPQRSR